MYLKYKSKMYLCIFYGFYLILLGAATKSYKNVCKNFQDYQTMQHNPNCWYNPDVESSPQQIAVRYGYPFESYKIETQDGYLVTLFRIPYKQNDTNRKNQSVFFQHGIGADASCWMIFGLKSIVFVFSNNGYDVWLSNCRGTRYSKQHVKYKINDPKFWDFSFHEMALYDIPAMIEFIATKTGHKGEIIYIGHSMGTTISYIYSSLKSEDARTNLKSIISLAPVAYLDHILLLVKLTSQFIDPIWKIVKSLGLGTTNSILELAVNVFHGICKITFFFNLCKSLIGMLTGENEEEFVASIFPLLVNSFQDVSSKTLVHFGQLVNSNHGFEFFDYGPKMNSKIYNSVKPPEYPVEKIKVPIHLVYGRRDPIATEEDVLYLYEKIKAEKTINQVFNFTHFNFLAATHILEFYQILIKYLNGK